MPHPLVTVLMPVYNAEKFLAEAVESILGQTFRDFEFLIIDDGSTDATIQIIQRYNDPRIRLVRNETNLGISATLNKGIQLARTNWIARMDADDISYPDRIEKQYRYCEQHPDCALLSSWTRVITESKQEIRTEKYKSRYYYYNLTFECWVYHPTIFCSRQALLDVGGYTVPYAEDFELFWQLSRRFRIWNLSEVLLDYRITSTSLHQVTKKVEYAEAQAGQVLRNIHYYTSLQLSDAELECLRHNFQPLLQQNNIMAIVKTLDKLQLINKGILGTQNVNKDEAAITEAAVHKRNFIIEYFARNLPVLKAILLLIRLGEFGLLYRLSKGYILRK